MAHQVFISHSSKDREVADAVCEALEAEGVKCWIAPRDIRPGQEWPVAIVDAVTSSRAMVLVFSNNANLSKDVAKETLLAINSDIDVYPVKIDESSPSGVMLYYLADKEWFDDISLSLEERVRKVLEAIRPLLSAREVDGGGQIRKRELPAEEKASAIRAGPSPVRVSGKRRIVVYAVLALAALLAAVLLYRFVFPAGPGESLPAASETAVFAGSFHSLILTENGELYSFGNGRGGRLGLGEDDNNDVYSPRPVDLPGQAVSVSAGQENTLVMLESGEVYGFGLNKTFELGLGSTGKTGKPQKTEELRGVRAVSVGAFHSLALLDSGEVFSFGWGFDGQLGHGSSTNEPIPRKIESLSGVQTISAGSRFSLVLLENGQVYSFGNGQYGQLGHGEALGLDVPRRIANLPPAKAVSAGTYHSLVIDENGDVYSFGGGWEGQLGHGDREDLLRPRRIVGLSDAVAVAAGGRHSLVLTEEGAVYSFGAGSYGMLGHGDEETILVPTRIEGIGKATAIAAGWQHSMIAFADGRVAAFGRNEFGQLGRGNTLNSNLPEVIYPFAEEEQNR